MNRIHPRFSQAMAALLLVLAAATQAVTVSPAGPFSATGRLALTKGIVPVSCMTTFTGTVSAEGRITITSLTFSGSNFICKRITALGLPWSGHADSDTQLTLNGMQVDIRAPLLGGQCGPVNVVATWDGNLSAAHFKKAQLLPDCSIDGVMTTSPKVIVTP